MTAEEIKNLRWALAVTQVQLASMIGVHPISVSRFERGTMRPTPWQTEVLALLALAVGNEAAVRSARRILALNRPVIALSVLLAAASSDTCPVCNGTRCHHNFGRDPNEPCSRCDGTGVVFVGVPR